MATPEQVEALRTYVGASAAENAFIGECWGTADGLVTRFIGSAEAVPVDVVLRATLECGSELFHRRKAPNGIAQFATPDGAPVRVARDPMVGAYPILFPFVGVGIG